jgi:murein DD-endopeptidase MepM/ murein hydrolase activator NlpD
VKLIALLLLLLGLGLAQSAEETLLREVERQQEMLRERQQERERIEAELAASRQELDRRLAELDAVGQRLGALREERRGLLADIADLEGDIEATLRRIASEEENLARLTERVQDLMLSLYYGRPNRNLRVLARSESLFDLRVRNHYLSLMTQQDVAVLRALEATLERLAAERARLQAERAELSEREAALRANEEVLAANEAELRQAVARLESSREGQLALRLETIRREEEIGAALLEAQDALERERERLRREAELARLRAEAAERAAQRAAQEREREAAQRAAEERARARGQVQEAEQALQRLEVPVRQGEAQFIMPISGPRIAGRYNDGCDSCIALRAEAEGAPVFAAMSGLVIEAARLSANGGYLVTIQHSPNLITTYTNLQPPVVSRGSRVAQGEIIGYLGGGALIRPDTLHFYVSVGASGANFVNPAAYLGIR